MQVKCFGEVLPYLEIKKNEEKKEEVLVPNLVGLSIKEAEKIIKELGLDIKLDEDKIDKENTIIKEQIPKEGIRVNKESKIIIKY